MPLPKGDQYSEAVQHPQLCFSDAELRTATVETDSLGLPKPYSGGFTVTFKLQGKSINWATRCLTRDIMELPQRYKAIGEFFASKPSRYFTDAKYMAEGIRVNGTWHPVVKMKWIEGETLDGWLNNPFNRSWKSASIIADLQALMKELEMMGIAHGDLQHGNIIVKNNRLYLVDYDGIFVPELKQLRGTEIGHPNYQHPLRQARHFDDRMDRFSAILLYISLRALQLKPKLWQKYHNGENLLFTRQDLIAPHHSPVFKELMQSRRLRKITTRFLQVCQMAYEDVPSLSRFLNENIPLPPPVRTLIPDPAGPDLVPDPTPGATPHLASVLDPEAGIFNRLYGTPPASAPELTTGNATPSHTDNRRAEPKNTSETNANRSLMTWIPSFLYGSTYSLPIILGTVGGLIGYVFTKNIVGLCIGLFGGLAAYGLLSEKISDN